MANENEPQMTKNQKTELGIFVAVICVANLAFFGLGFWLPATLDGAPETHGYWIAAISILAFWLSVAALRRLLGKIRGGYKKWMASTSILAQSIPLLLPTVMVVAFNFLPADFHIPDLGRKIMGKLGVFALAGYFILSFSPTFLALLATNQMKATL